MKLFCTCSFILLLISCSKSDGDQAVNTVATSTPRVIIPKNAPQFTLTAPAAGSTVGQTFQLEGTCKKTNQIVIIHSDLPDGEMIFPCVQETFSGLVELSLMAVSESKTFTVVARHTDLGGSYQEPLELNVEFNLKQVIPGLQLWLDASDLTTLTNDTGCSQMIEKKDGVAIACWRDKSGHDHHLVQNTKKKKPTYFSHPNQGAVHFNGKQFFEDSDGHLYINDTTGFELIAVIKADKVPADMGLFDTEKPDKNDERLALRYDSSGRNSGCVECLKIGIQTTDPDFSEIQAESEGGMQSVDRSIIGASWNTGHTLKLYLNGIDTLASKPAVAEGALKGANRVIVGDGPKGGWEGQILEILYYDRELTEEQRDAVIEELRLKWLY